MEKMAIRGLPFGPRSILSRSMGSPSTHPFIAGAAMKALSFIARPWRSAFGKKDSMSKTPMRWTGGDWTAAMSSAMSMLLPCCHADSRIEHSRMCSRLWSGSVSMPSRSRRLVTVVVIRSRSRSASSRIARPGASKDRRMDTGMPALLPGV